MKVGDTVKVTFKTYGEAVYRKGEVLHQLPHVSVRTGVIEYIGPECPFPSVEVVRCKGFQFYSKDTGINQIVEVMP